MNAFTTSYELAKALEAALPMPKNMRGFTLRCYVDEAVTLTVESYPGIDVGNFATVMAEYDMKIRSKPEKCAGSLMTYSPYPVGDFDGWMRERTDAAHSAYMDRIAQLPQIGADKR